MSDTNLIAFLGALVSMIAVITPVLRLNGSIVKLNTTLEHVLANDHIRDKRLETHGKEIDRIVERQRENEKALSNIDLRVKVLEKEEET